MKHHLPRRRPGFNKQRQFVEEVDGIYRWPRFMSASEKRKYRDHHHWSYNHDLGDNDLLFSDDPWPLNNDVEPPHNNCRDDDNDDETAPRLVQINSRKVYLPHKPSQKPLEKQPPVGCIAPAALSRAWVNEGVSSRLGGNPFDNTPLLPVDEGECNGFLYDSDDSEILDYTCPKRVHPQPPSRDVVFAFASHDQWSGKRSQSTSGLTLHGFILR